MSLFSLPAHGNASTASKKPLLTWIQYMEGFPCKNYKTYTPPIDITKNGCKAGTLVTFAQKIEAIAAKVGVWKNPKDLFRSKDFVAIHKHPLYYWEENLIYLADPRYPEFQKQIAIYAMQGLDDMIYLKYLDKCCILYTDKELSASLLSKVIYCDFLGYYPEISDKGRGEYHTKITTCLNRLTSNQYLPKELNFAIKEALTKTRGARFTKEDRYYHYYANPNYPFKFSKIIQDANNEFLGYIDGELECSMRSNFHLSDLVIIIDHPFYYIQRGEADPNTASFFIHSRRFSEAEHRLAIFAMYQLNGSKYIELLNEIERVHRIKAISPYMIEDLFYCLYPTGDRKINHPFFILDYKRTDIQHALDGLLNIPTISCGLKEIIRKVKNGTLATKEEMAYMEGYRQFRKKYFTLYETIPPRENQKHH